MGKPGSGYVFRFMTFLERLFGLWVLYSLASDFLLSKFGNIPCHFTIVQKKLEFDFHVQSLKSIGPDGDQ